MRRETIENKKESRIKIKWEGKSETGYCPFISMLPILFFFIFFFFFSFSFSYQGVFVCAVKMYFIYGKKLIKTYGARKLFERFCWASYSCLFFDSTVMPKTLTIRVCVAVFLIFSPVIFPSSSRELSHIHFYLLARGLTKHSMHKLQHIYNIFRFHENMINIRYFFKETFKNAKKFYIYNITLACHVIRVRLFYIFFTGSPFVFDWIRFEKSIDVTWKLWQCSGDP